MDRSISMDRTLVHWRYQQLRYFLKMLVPVKNCLFDKPQRTKRVAGVTGATAWQHTQPLLGLFAFDKQCTSSSRRAAVNTANATMATSRLPPNLAPVAIKTCVQFGQRASETCGVCPEGQHPPPVSQNIRRQQAGPDDPTPNAVESHPEHRELSLLTVP
jgi:hypothetical protein